MALFLIYATFITFTAPGVKASCSVPVFTTPPPVCPGQTAVFTCKSHDDQGYGRTTWVVGDSSAPVYGCPLNHYQWTSATTQCGSFYGRAIQESPANCFVSELRATATPALNNTSVECLFVPGIGNVPRGSGTLQVIGPIETKICAIGKQDISDGSSLITRSVVIHWSISSKLNITQYIVTVRPPASPCSGGGGGQCVVGDGDIGFSSRELSLQLELGVAYEVTVSTVNCGIQAGRDSDPVAILLQLPDIPTCEAVPHYRDNHLFLIEVTWPRNKEPSGLRNTVSEVEYYTVMFDPGFISFPVLTPNTSCHSDECYFNFTLTSVPHPFTNDNATFSLLLTATSAVGESSPALCSLYPIGVKNHVKVDSITGPHVSVVIRFPQNHTSKRCNVTFGYNDTLQTSALSSREDGDEIEYALHSVVAGQTYAYSLECSVDIRADGDVSEMKFTDQGNFEAGCFLQDLILAEESILFLNDLCLELPNGLVCYNGHLPGSSAVYICREDHSLQHGDGSRVCEESGEWSGEVPVCLPLTDYNTTDATTTGTGDDSSGGPTESTEADVNLLLMAGVPSIAGILICISCLIGALLHRTLSKYSCNCNIKTKKKPALPRHYYDEITLNTPTVTAPELLASSSGTPDAGTSTFHMTAGNTEIETSPNAAYMQVNRM